MAYAPTRIRLGEWDAQNYVFFSDNPAQKTRPSESK